MPKRISETNKTLEELGYGRVKSPIGVPTAPGWISTKQISLDLGVTQRRAQQMCSRGEVRARRAYAQGKGCIGSAQGYWRVTVEDYVEFLEKERGLDAESAPRFIAIIERLLNGLGGTVHK